MSKEVLDLSGEQRALDPETGKLILLTYTPEETDQRRAYFKGSRQTSLRRYSGRTVKHKIDLTKTFNSAFLR